MKKKYFKNNIDYFKFYNKNKDNIVVINLKYCYNYIKNHKTLSSICLFYDINLHYQQDLFFLQKMHLYVLIYQSQKLSNFSDQIVQLPKS